MSLFRKMKGENRFDKESNSIELINFFHGWKLSGLKRARGQDQVIFNQKDC